MRIISGKWKGRKFHPPAKKWPTRPTTDFAKEGLFNILQNNFYFEDLVVLDLFGGTGNHSYEFLSRGTKDVTYVDKFQPAVNFVKGMAIELDVAAYLKVVRNDVFRFVRSNARQYDYIFAGPPYPLPKLDAIPDLIFDNNILKEGGWFVLEHNPNHDFTKHAHFFQVRNYGQTIFSFFKNA